MRGFYKISKPQITSDESVTGAILAELGKDKNDTAMGNLRAKSFDIRGLQTPRTRVHIDYGEWDAN